METITDFTVRLTHIGDEGYREVDKTAGDPFYAVMNFDVKLGSKRIFMSRLYSTIVQPCNWKDTMC